MSRRALGMVETRGFLAAVEAADAMCKTAQVELTRFEVVRDARVTVIVRGEVAEVESAVQAGGRAAAKVGELLGTRVIPALESDVDFMVSSVRPAKAGPKRT